MKKSVESPRPLLITDIIEIPERGSAFYQRALDQLNTAKEKAFLAGCVKGTDADTLGDRLRRAAKISLKLEPNSLRLVFREAPRSMRDFLDELRVIDNFDPDELEKNPFASTRIATGLISAECKRDQRCETFLALPTEEQVAKQRAFSVEGKAIHEADMSIYWARRGKPLPTPVPDDFDGYLRSLEEGKHPPLSILDRKLCNPILKLDPRMNEALKDYGNQLREILEQQVPRTKRGQMKGVLAPIPSVESQPQPAS